VGTELACTTLWIHIDAATTHPRVIIIPVGVCRAYLTGDKVRPLASASCAFFLLFFLEGDLLGEAGAEAAVEEMSHL
jgi:hypothetical protein